jgi:hypothetical protein
MALQALKAPKTAEELINGIDWKLLKKQKIQLLKVINKDAVTPKEKESLEGILNLLDSVQDFAVDVLGVNEKEVFNLHKD